jgi:hypothetical protein
VGVGLAGCRRLVACAVLVTEKGAVELGECSCVGGVEDDGSESGK